MSKLIITIGGTGARCGSASSFALAANMFSGSGKIGVMPVDKDAGNGTSRAFNDYIGNTYAGIVNALGKDNPDRPFAKFDLALETNWKLDSLLDRGTGLSDTLRDYCTDFSQKFLPLFYTEAEQSMNLRDGFKRHPNIGALVFEAIKNDPAFNQAIDTVLQEAQGGTAEIFIMGSIFGGTGASMFLNLADYIRLRAQKHDNSKNTRIGGALMLPYFKIPLAPSDVKRTGDYVSDEDLDEATQTALQYYKSIPNLVRHGNKEGCEPGSAIFDALYLIGLNPHCSTRHDEEEHPPVYAEGGSKQESECCIVDFMAACALCHFFEASEKEQKNETDTPLYVQPGTPDQNLYTLLFTDSKNDELLKIDWDNLPPNAKAIQNLFRFAVYICGYLYPDYRNAGSKMKNCLYLKLQNKEPSADSLEAIYQFCFRFLEFFLPVAATRAGGDTICNLVDIGALKQLVEFCRKASYNDDDVNKIIRLADSAFVSPLAVKSGEITSKLIGAKKNIGDENDLIAKVYALCSRE